MFSEFLPSPSREWLSLFSYWEVNWELTSMMVKYPSSSSLKWEMNKDLSLCFREAKCFLYYSLKAEIYLFISSNSYW
jgi:hypothetical protein